MKGNKKFWILALILALAAAVLFYQFLMALQKKYEPKNVVQVMVATNDIEQNTVVGPGDVEIARIPSPYVHPSAVRNKKAVVGKVVISKISKGEQILSSRVLGDSTGQGRMSYTVPSGKRAISVSVNEVTGVSGFIRPSDRIDVVATVNIPVGSGGQESVKPYTVLALQDVEVLAVGKSVQVAETEGGAPKGNVESKTLTLAVEPRQALVLTMAAERGTIRTMLRPPGETETPAVPAMELPHFLVPVSVP